MILRPLAPLARAVVKPQPILSLSAKRTISSLPLLRPSTAPSTLAILRPAPGPTPTPFLLSAPPTTTTANAAAADLIPAAAISRHPALLALQIRCGPRNTMAGHTRLIQKRRHGFLNRLRSRDGRKILARRKAKGRKRIAWG